MEKYFLEERFRTLVCIILDLVKDKFAQNFDVKNSLNEFRVLKMVEKKYVGKFYVYFIE